MNQPKPFLTIKGKCPKCEDYYEDRNFCKICNYSGQQTTEIYALRDFEKCEEKFHKNFNGIRGKVKCYKCGFIRNEIGYKIPKEYVSYEIKKVSEIIEDELQAIIKALEPQEDSVFNKDAILDYLSKIYNLKEDGRVIIRRR